MTVSDLKAALSKYPDEMRVVCFDGDGHDAPQVTTGVLRGDDEYLHYGIGALDDATDANEVDVEDGGIALALYKVCVIKPDFV